MKRTAMISIITLSVALFSGQVLAAEKNMNTDNKVINHAMIKTVSEMKDMNNTSKTLKKVNKSVDSKKKRVTLKKDQKKLTVKNMG